MTKVTGRGRALQDATLEALQFDTAASFTGGRVRPCASRVASQLNALAPHAPEGWMQRPASAAWVW
ncbi:MAG: hypothetical protein H0X30_00130 [Anaerolineae bacterium]|nr:hypothetical protein [Anaerolineae bacterium]